MSAGGLAAAALAAAMALMGCKREVPPPGPPAEIPTGYPIPAGAELAESAILGRLATFVYRVPRDPETVIGEIRAGLDLLGWPVETRADAAITERGEKTVTATASAAGAATRLVIEVRTAAIDAGIPAGPDAAALAAPPAGYPAGFPFLPGPTLGRGARGVVLDYRRREPAELATAIRDRAEAQGWMCTQGDAKFVCASRGRSVDLRLARRGRGTRLTVLSTESAP